MQSEKLPNVPTQLDHNQRPAGLNIWVGIWAMLAGVLLFSERIGWLTQDIEWGAPLALTVVGVSVIYDNLRSR